jgi:hypothetical protein
VGGVTFHSLKYTIKKLSFFLYLPTAWDLSRSADADAGIPTGSPAFPDEEKSWHVGIQIQINIQIRLLRNESTSIYRIDN